MKPIEVWIGRRFFDDHEVTMEYADSNMWNPSCHVQFEDTQTSRIYNKLVVTMLNRIYYVDSGEYFHLR